MEILILSVLDKSDPAIRYRLTYPLDILKKEQDLNINYLSFYNSSAQKLMSGKNIYLKLIVFFRQFIYFFFKLILSKKKYNIVIVKSFVTPFGNYIIDHFVKKILTYEQLYYDIDDGIYLNQTQKQNKLLKPLRNARSKVRYWIKNADKLLICNSIIESDLLELYPIDLKRIVRLYTLPIKNQYFNNNEELIKAKKSATINFIWLGSPNTQDNLHLCRSFIERIKDKIPQFRLFIIGASKDFSLFKELSYVELIPWSQKEEKRYMQISHFGLNPLIESEFETRKCAFKVFQYYRAGIMPIVSAVGINTKLVEKYFGISTANFQDDTDKIINFIKQKISSDLIQMSTVIFGSTVHLSLEQNSLVLKNIILNQNLHSNG